MTETFKRYRDARTALMERGQWNSAVDAKLRALFGLPPRVQGK
jgi:hypothetical protein